MIRMNVRGVTRIFIYSGGEHPSALRFLQGYADRATMRYNPGVETFGEFVMFRLLTRHPAVEKPPVAKPAGGGAQAFVFVDVPRALTLVDGELELVEPEEKYMDALLAACHHPLTQRDMPVQANTTRASLESFLSASPRGRAQPDPAHLIAPGYTFWMRIRPLTPDPRLEPLPATMAGSISLRLGHSPNLDMYLGHIGYHVLPPARGHRYALRACRLLLPLARMHGHRQLWITCNPENAASPDGGAAGRGADRPGDRSKGQSAVFAGGSGEVPLSVGFVKYQ